MNNRDAHPHDALAHLAAGRLIEAERLLRALVQADPQQIDAQAQLGAVLQQRGHLAEAIARYESALKLDPDDIGLHCNLAKAHADAGQFEPALAIAEAARERAKGHPYVIGTLGAVHIDRNDYRAARAALGDPAVRDALDDMALVNLALAEASLGDRAAADGTLATALERNPHNARALADRADVLCRLGTADAAVQLCRDFLATHPGERLVLGALALALAHAGNRDEARALTDCAALVHVFDTADTQGFASVEAFNRALADAVCAEPSRLTNPVSKSTSGGDQTGELDLDTNAAYRGLRALIETNVETTANRFIDTGFARHPVMAPAQEPQSLRVWGTILRAGGRQTPHMHPLGWLSGVYYARVPEDMNSDGENNGWLEFNRPPERLLQSAGLDAQAFEPREGRMIIFPSWFWHQTLPFASTKERISVAFDVVPTSALRML